MGQVLRVTVGKTDHSIKLLNINISDPEKAELEVEWQGEKLRIVRQGRSWIAQGYEQADIQALAESVGKALALRYRF